MGAAIQGQRNTTKYAADYYYSDNNGADTQQIFFISTNIFAGTDAEDQYEDYFGDIEDSWGQNQTSEEEEEIPFAIGGRGLFDAEQSEELFNEDFNDSEDGGISFSDASAGAGRQERLFSFADPENKTELIKMTQADVNQIFNKRRFGKNKNRHLTKSDRKKARECRKKDKLFSRRDKKCYHPLSEEPCRAANKWFVALAGK